MTSNFRCKFKLNFQSCLQENVYIILFQSRVNGHFFDGITFINDIILSNLLLM